MLLRSKVSKFLLRSCMESGGLDHGTDRSFLVRALVEQRLQTELTGEKRAFLDRQIDAELANM